MARRVVVYHANCWDGQYAAWIHRKVSMFGSMTEYIKAAYTDAPLDNLEAGDSLTLLDFSYPREVLDALYAKGVEILVVDHHQTAILDLQGAPFPCVFDTAMCGARLTFLHFAAPVMPAPWLLAFVEKRDLWQIHSSSVEEQVSAGLQSFPISFETLDDLELEEFGRPRLMQAGTVADSQPLTDAEAESFRAALQHHYAVAEGDYRWALRSGVPKELARILLPVGRYSRMRASANLRNWLQFLTLRLDLAAQWEIQQYAAAVGRLVAMVFPRTWSLFAEALSPKAAVFDEVSKQG